MYLEVSEIVYRFLDTEMIMLLFGSIEKLYANLPGALIQNESQKTLISILLTLLHCRAAYSDRAVVYTITKTYISSSCERLLIYLACISTLHFLNGLAKLGLNVSFLGSQSNLMRRCTKTGLLEIPRVEAAVSTKSPHCVLSEFNEHTAILSKAQKCSRKREILKEHFIVVPSKLVKLTKYPWSKLQKILSQYNL